ELTAGSRAPSGGADFGATGKIYVRDVHFDLAGAPTTLSLRDSFDASSVHSHRPRREEYCSRIPGSLGVIEQSTLRAFASFDGDCVAGDDRQCAGVARPFGAGVELSTAGDGQVSRMQLYDACVTGAILISQSLNVASADVQRPRRDEH